MPLGLLVVSGVVAIVLLAPLVFLLFEAQGAGTSSVGSPDLEAAHRDPALEHRPSDAGGHRAVRGHRHNGGLVRRAHGPARASCLGGPRRGPVRHSRFRGELRVGVAVHVGRRVFEVPCW